MTNHILNLPLSFGTSQIYEVEFTDANMKSTVRSPFTLLDDDGEDGVRARAMQVHLGRCGDAVLLPDRHNLVQIIGRMNDLLTQTLYVNT